MAAPTDRVQVLKQESAAGGGDEADRDPFNVWETINETEDGISAAGVFVQEVGGTPDEAAAIYRESGDMTFKDENNAPVTLTELRVGLTPTEVGQIIIAATPSSFVAGVPVVTSDGFIVVTADGKIVVT